MFIAILIDVGEDGNEDEDDDGDCDEDNNMEADGRLGAHEVPDDRVIEQFQREQQDIDPHVEG